MVWGIPQNWLDSLSQDLEEVSMVSRQVLARLSRCPFCYEAAALRAHRELTELLNHTLDRLSNVLDRTRHYQASYTHPSLTMAKQICTKFFIISDTHGEEFPLPDAEFDVATHCGDLTEESKLVEFQRSVKLLGNIQAPLQLVIAGNHGFTLDPPMVKKKLAEAQLPLDDPAVRIEYGSPGGAHELFTTVSHEGGVKYLDEGTHEFTLQNGAKLTVYASSYTPSVDDWRFQYHPDEKHEWQVGDADVVVTHDPPRGVSETIGGGERAGDPGLFAAVAQSRPKLHCFGHMHRCWGAKLVSWTSDVASENPTYFTDIDGENMRPFLSLSSIEPKTFDGEEARSRKQIKLAAMKERRCALAEVDGVKSGQPLFVNAAIASTEEGK